MKGKTLTTLLLKLMAWIGLLLLWTQCQTSPAKKNSSTHGLENHSPGVMVLRTADQSRFRCSVWPKHPVKKPQGILLAIHGLSGASSDFSPLGQHFSPKNWVIYAPEIRGQGNDPNRERRGDVASNRDWMSDLLILHRSVRSRYPDTPIFWYGESLGSLIVLNTFASHPDLPSPPDGLILSSPAIGLREPLSKFKRSMLLALSHVFPQYRLTLEQLSGIPEDHMRVTSETTHRGQMEITPHHVSSYTLRQLSEIGKWIEDSERVAQHILVPTLILYTQHDPLVSKGQVEQWSRWIQQAPVTLEFFPQSYHLILHDQEQAVALQKIESWLQQKITPKISRNF